MVAVALAAAMTMMAPSYAWGDAVQAAPVRAQEAAHQQMIDDAIAMATTLPVEATSFDSYESAAGVLRQQLENMGLERLDVVAEVASVASVAGVGTPSSASALRDALYVLAEARGDDASGLATWEPWAMPAEVELAMAEVILVSADIEESMRAAVQDLSFEDVQELEAYFSDLQAAYDAKDISDLVDNEDFRNSRILQIPAGEALWNAMVDLAADSLRLTEAAETLYELLQDPAVAASIDFSSAAVDPTGNIEVDDENPGDPTGHRTLYIDQGGDSSYTGFHACGTALGLAGFIATDPAPVPRAASTYLDMGGDDEHLAILCGTGGGTLGTGILMDAAGDDLYLTGAIGQGGGLGGVGVHVDDAGNDIYGTLGIGQGAAAVGAGVLTDREGDDIYVGLLIAQGAGVGTLILADAAGAGVLADGSGEDIFGSITFAQGFGMINGHGAAVHVDGDDLFILANPIGQLAPAIGQGAGIDLGTGVLAGGSGDDTYALASLAVLVDPINALALGQGYGGDGGSGTFADLDGSDYNLLLSGAGDVAFGGATDDSVASAACVMPSRIGSATEGCVSRTWTGWRSCRFMSELTSRRRRRSTNAPSFRSEFPGSMTTNLS